MNFSAPQRHPLPHEEEPKEEETKKNKIKKKEHSRLEKKNPTVLLPAPTERSSKKKKKRKKKHKSSAPDPPVSSASLDPQVQSALRALCRKLDQCTISRSSGLGKRKCATSPRPSIFQCRKYRAVPASIETGAGNSNRGKRKKADDDGSRRKGKSNKRNNNNGQTNAALSSVSIPKPPAVTPGQLISDATAATVIQSVVELLLPLKKRHHHLAASEPLLVESTCTTDKADRKCDGAVAENPSHEQLQPKLAAAPPTTNSRKRPAPDDLTEESGQTEQRAEDRNVIATDPSLQKRNKKKDKVRKKDNLDLIIEQVSRQPPSLSPSPTTRKISEPSTTAQPSSDGQAASKKKMRRRKTFNRTGFPSVKKKRKKLSGSPLPPKEVVGAPTANSGPALKEAGIRQAKRIKLTTTKEDESEDGLVPEQASDSPSSDEVNPPSVPLPVTKKPLKRKRSAAPSFRKRYLPAGLLSNLFKEDPSEAATTNPSSSTSLSTTSSERTDGRPCQKQLLTYVPEEHEYGLLPSPFYCEKELRRVRNDFQLPFDLWYLQQEGKLPGRDHVTTVPSWNYRKIRNNVYYDVKPPFTNDAEPCNCTFPPPDATGEWRNTFPLAIS